MPYAFLSPEWIDSARALHEKCRTDEEPAVVIRMNLVVDSVPFDEGHLDAHLDTTSGLVEIDIGHLERADVKVCVDYDIAKAILVEQNAEAAMGAFMAGRIRVEGDMTKLLAYQAAPPSAHQVELAAQLRAMTS